MTNYYSSLANSPSIVGLRLMLTSIRFFQNFFRIERLQLTQQSFQSLARLSAFFSSPLPILFIVCPLKMPFSSRGVRLATDGQLCEYIQ